MVKSEKIGMNEKLEAVFQTISNGEILESKTPEEKGLWKSKEFVTVFKRIALNPKTLTNIEGFFVQKICFRVPNREDFAYHYFYWEKGFSLPCCRIIDSRMGRLCGLTFQVNVSDATYVKKIGMPKRVSNEQVRKIMLERVYESLPFLGVFSESGEENVSAKRD